MLRSFLLTTQAQASSKQSGNYFQKNSQQQQTEAADKQTNHQDPALGFGKQGKHQRNKPHQESNFQDH
jgi:hypothetical protein